MSPAALVELDEWGEEPRREKPVRAITDHGWHEGLYVRSRINRVIGRG